MNYELINSRNQSITAIEQILLSRGITDVYHYLNTTDDDILSPMDLNNIEKGAKLLISHIAKNSKVMIIIDADCDGYTSAALLINYLNNLFPSFVQNNIIYKTHTGKQHGIILDMIPEDISLLICPDSASSNFEEHEYLFKRGIDVLILDHHNSSKESEYACVINNQLCDYANKDLCGAAIVYKFCCYIDSLLETNYANNYLDLVATALIADVMNLQQFETKHLITLGLSNIKNPFLKALTAKQAFSLGDTITPTGIGFYIAPYINAITRSGTMEEKITVFESMLEFKGYEQIPSTKRGCAGEMETRVEQACRNCVNVKNRQTRSRDSGLELIENLIEQQDLLKNKILVVTLDKENSIEPNLAGLIANQLMGKYKRPVLILSYMEQDNEIYWAGSGRNSERSSLKDLRGYVEQTGLVEYAEGHSSAFGCCIKASNLSAFIKKTNKDLENFDFSAKYYVDFIYNSKSIDENEILNIANYQELWGQGISEPLIVIENLTITDANIFLFKRNTLKIDIPHYNKLSLIKFGSSEEEYNNLLSDSGCVTINVIGKCAINSFNGNPQLKIVDYEIVRKTAYYF